MNKLLLFFLLFSSFSLQAQDVIQFKDGKTKEVKLVQISDDEVQYYLWTNQTGPLFINSIDKIDFITFKNGEVERFVSNDAAPAKEDKAGEFVSTDKVDLLYLLNGEVVDGKVESVNPSSVSIRRVNLPSQPRTTYKKSDLEKLIYSDGTVDQFIAFKEKEKAKSEQVIARQEYRDHTIRWTGGQTFRTKQKTYYGEEVLSLMEGSKENSRLMKEGFGYHSEARALSTVGGIVSLGSIVMTLVDLTNEDNNASDVGPGPVIAGLIIFATLSIPAGKINQKGNACIKSAVDSHNAGLKERISFQFGGTSNGIGLVGYF